jgi:hypothetical protein
MKKLLLSAACIAALCAPVLAMPSDDVIKSAIQKVGIPLSDEEIDGMAVLVAYDTFCIPRRTLSGTVWILIGARVQGASNADKAKMGAAGDRVQAEYRKNPNFCQQHDAAGIREIIKDLNDNAKIIEGQR